MGIDVPKYEQVPEEKCHYINVPKCHKVPQQHCSEYTVPHCKKIPKEQCKKVPKESCHYIHYYAPGKAKHRECQKEVKSYKHEYKQNMKRSANKLKYPSVLPS